MNEIFIKIPDYENYMISNNGKIISLNTNKELKQQIDRYGYLKVSLSKNNVQKRRSVHQLVAITFLNHKPDGTMKFVVNHIDKNKTNNNVTNLEIITCRDNINHSIDKSNKKSRLLGVNMNKQGDFFTSISYKNKIYYLGIQKNELITNKIYLDACNAIKNNDFENFYIKIKEENKNKFTSKYNGIGQHPVSKKWILNVRINGKQKRIGQYNSEDEAYEQSLIINEKIKNNTIVEYLQKINPKSKTNKIEKFIYKDKYGFRVDVCIYNEKYYIGIFKTIEDAIKNRNDFLLSFKNGNANSFINDIKKRYLEKSEYENLFFNNRVNKWVIIKNKKIVYYKTKKAAIKHL